MSASTVLWIVIAVTIFLTIIIPVTTLWVRWKLKAPRRGGKRSISIQLEEMEIKKSSKETSGSSSTPDTGSKPTSFKSSGNKKEPQPGNVGQNVLDVSLNRNRGSPAQDVGDINIINNININGRAPHHHGNQAQGEGPPPMSPRIAVESQPLNRPARPPENQPWMHQDQNGRWVPREEGYLHPGLPPSPHLRDWRPSIQPVDQVRNTRRERRYIPGEWPH